MAETVSGEYFLKHNANHEARAVAQNIFGDDLKSIGYTTMPFTVFASLEVAGIGAHEEELRTADEEFATNVYQYEGTARGQAMKATGS